MKNTLLRTNAARTTTAAVLCLLLASGALASQFKRREYMTAQEIEMVRDAQQLDSRIGVFVKLAERRLLAINGVPAKLSPKDLETWGELPKGSRADYLSDFAGLLDEAIENIDDTASRTPESPQLGKSVKKLAEAARRFLAQLMPLRDSTPDGPERESLERALDNLEQIVESVKKVPEDEPAGKKPGKKG